MQHLRPTSTISEYSEAIPYHRSDEVYQGFLDALQHNINQAWDDNSLGLFFKTEGPGLDFDTYLSVLPKTERQHYNCRCCRKFFTELSDLVYISKTDGAVKSVLWNSVVPYPHDNFQALAALRAKRNDFTHVRPYLPMSRHVGVVESGGWKHAYAVLPAEYPVYPSTPLRNSRVGELSQNYRLAKELPTRYTKDQLSHAIASLSEPRFQPVKHLLQAVLDYAIALEAIHYPCKGNALVSREALYWRVALTRSDICHFSSSLAATYAEDRVTKGPLRALRALKAGLAPLQYKRPQSLPTEQAVRQAEGLVENLGYSDSLRRRFAASPMDVIPVIWSSQEAAIRGVTTSAGVSNSSGVFRGVPTKNAAGPISPATSMSFSRFRRTVLPLATRIQFLATTAGYSALTTAAVPGSKPLFTWGNTFAHYTHVELTLPRQWGLRAGELVEVHAVYLAPYMWDDEAAHPQYRRWAMFALENCYDRNVVTSSLFPNFLVPELQPARKTIEAYSNTHPIESSSMVYKGSYSGVRVVDGADALKILVTTRGGIQQEITLTSWD